MLAGFHRPIGLDWAQTLVATVAAVAVSYTYLVVVVALVVPAAPTNPYFHLAAQPVWGLAAGNTSPQLRQLAVV